MTPTNITSRANPLIRKLASLNDTRGIRKHGVYLVGGIRLVREALNEKGDTVEAIITSSDATEPTDAPSIKTFILTPTLFNSINVFGTPPPLLLMRRPDLPEFQQQEPWPDGCTLFIPFSDPENVGAVIRCAAALGAARAVLTAEAANPFLPKAVRAAAGAIWRIPVMQTGPLEQLVIQAPYPFFTLDAGGHSLETIPPPQGPYSLIIGREGPGLPEHLRQAATCLSIPMQRNVESLNAATAAAIALWTWRRMKLQLDHSS